MLGMEEASRVGVMSPKASRINTLADKVAKQTATIEEATELAESSLSVKYVRTWGDRAGEVVGEVPVITNIADTLKKGEKIKVTDAGVKIEGSKREWMFGKLGSKNSKQWDITKSDVLEANARYQWAHSIEINYPKGAELLEVNANDIPLLERVAKDLGENWRDSVKITGLEAGETVSGNLIEFISDRKLKIADKLLS